ncbi:SRPBCC domain-containing protein [Candidatus Micrarchaeota archaeon]|nr:SRPBCC domain-containing protein [Candidatus Micrarchaeota archaeon]
MADLKFGKIKQTEFFDASPIEVYLAIIDPKKHSEFTGAKATCQAKVKGKFTAWDGYCFGENLELIEGKKIVQSWKTSEWPIGYPPSKIEFEFKQEKGGTKMIFTQTNAPKEQIQDYKQGWIDNYWEPMKAYFAKKK